MTHPNPELIESRFKEPLDLYAEAYVPTGGFLRAVLENNLLEAFKRADPGALENLPHIVAYAYTELTGACWGDPGTVTKWLARRPVEVGA